MATAERFVMAAVSFYLFMSTVDHKMETVCSDSFTMGHCGFHTSYLVIFEYS